jgi:protein O-mannosyl-transferase
VTLKAPSPNYRVRLRPSRQLTIGGLFIIGGLVAFSSVLPTWFLSDDFAQIGKVLNGDLSVVWGTEHGGFFRPLFILSYAIDGYVWGARAFGFHLTNVLLHSLNAFLTFLFSAKLIQNLRLRPDARIVVPIGAGSLFLLHPSHTEAVSWISGRADLLATFFCLLSLVLCLSYLQSKRVIQLALSLISFAFALAAKESAICLPLLIGAVLLFEGRGTTLGKFLKIVAPYFFILFLFIGIRWVFLGALVGGYGASQHLNFAPGWLRDRLLEASVRSLLPALPWRLSAVLFKPLQSWVFILFSLGGIGAIATMTFMRRRWHDSKARYEQNRSLLAIGSMFLFSLLPVINLRLALYETQGERFLYLPTVFSCLWATYLLAILVGRQRILFVILFCILAFYSTTLYQTNQRWRMAAGLSKTIVDDLSHAANTDRLIIVNVPDNLQGVPVFHNGLPEAMEYFQNTRRVKTVEVIGFQNFQSITDEISMTPGSSSLTIRGLDERNIFMRVAPSQCLDSTLESRTSLEVRPKDCKAEWFYFRKGKMIRLADR